MTVVVLENQVAEKRSFLVLLEFDFYVGLTWPLLFGRLLVGHGTVGLDDSELVVLWLLHHIEVEVRFHIGE